LGFSTAHGHWVEKLLARELSGSTRTWKNVAGYVRGGIVDRIAEIQRLWTGVLPDQHIFKVDVESVQRAAGIIFQLDAEIFDAGGASC